MMPAHTPHTLVLPACHYHPALSIEVLFTCGTCVVHIHERYWRVSHVPTGCKVYDCRSYRQAQRVADMIGDDPIFAAGAITYEMDGTQKLAAYGLLQMALDATGGR